jgi:hypothetical protein
MDQFIQLWKEQTPAEEIFSQTSLLFRQYLHDYIAQSYKNESKVFKIHSVSLLLDYPGNSTERQWSHIDGEENCFQGSVLCGNGTVLTIEFPLLSPHCSNVEDLCQIWEFLPKESVTFRAISESIDCQDLLRKYGNLLNHDAKNPNNPPSTQKVLVHKKFKKKDKRRMQWNSIYPAGTIIQMKGNTIHAGPASDQKNCRAIFFLCCITGSF